MKRILCLATVALMTALLPLQDVPAIGDEAAERSEEGLEILKKVDRAIKAVDAVRFTSVTTPSGAATSFMPPAEGEGVMIGWSGGMPARFYAHVKTVDGATGEEIELTGGGDGDTFFIVDHRSRKAYEDMDPAVMGRSGRPLRGIGMMEFVHDAPFDDELNADVVQLQGTETVSGVECYKVHVVYAGGQGESTWYFSTEDYLPRKRVRHFPDQGQGEGAIEIVLTRLEVDPDVSPGLFKLQLPEGFEQIDDFAP